MSSSQRQLDYILPDYPERQTRYGSEKLAEDFTFFTLSNNTLADIVTPPGRYFVEMGEYHFISQALQLIRSAKPDLCLSLTSSTAFKQPVAELATCYLDKYLDFDCSLYDRIKTCLQEAVMNAVIHGNLDIHPHTLLNKDFHHYYETIIHQLSDPMLCMFRVTILVWYEKDEITLCVGDQGSGFVMTDKEPELDAVYGRGLAMIRAMSDAIWQTIPNHLFMKFKY